MEPSLHDYVVEKLTAGTFTYQEVADGCDMSRRTVEKIARREIADPGVSSIERLAAFFRAKESEAA